MTDRNDAAALEELWAGDFGSQWVERNGGDFDARAAFWSGILDRFPSRRVLEVGAAHGENLRHLGRHLAPRDLWGLDINRRALDAMATVAPGVNAAWGLARELPFRDGFFDLTFTVGLLIHQPDDTLPLVMGELVRTSRRWILCGEYHADEDTDVNYRGQQGVLVKRDFGGLYQRLFPDLVLREEGFLTMEEHGFDRVTYQVFERT
ncbi:MAG: methyltransferase domain-containing protein [Acidimicrobiales bacterium]|nr:methyltransferase domain-containing protein [Acidimicrobiales bacterium]